MILLRRLEAALVRGGFAAFRALGPVRASNLAGGVARCIGPLLPVSRVADTNLRLAMPELDAAARRRIVRGAWDNFGRTIGEYPHLPGFKASASGPGWEMVGGPILQELAAHQGPMIFFSGHLANWEVPPAVAASFGMTFATAYRPPDNPDVAAMIVDLRQRVAGGGPMFPKGARGARAMLAHLKRGGRLGMLLDQKMNDGIEVPFFGHPAMTAPALAALALRFRCPVVPNYAQRLGPARFRVICEEPLVLPDTGDRQADIATLTITVNQCLERWIRQQPDNWLWLHRRFPKSLYRN